MHCDPFGGLVQLNDMDPAEGPAFECSLGRSLRRLRGLSVVPWPMVFHGAARCAVVRRPPRLAGLAAGRHLCAAAEDGRQERTTEEGEASDMEDESVCKGRRIYTPSFDEFQKGVNKKDPTSDGLKPSFLHTACW